MFINISGDSSWLKHVTQYCFVIGQRPEVVSFNVIQTLTNVFFLPFKKQTNKLVEFDLLYKVTDYRIFVFIWKFKSFSFLITFQQWLVHCYLGQCKPPGDVNSDVFIEISWRGDCVSVTWRFEFCCIIWQTTEPTCDWSSTAVWSVSLYILLVIFSVVTMVTSMRFFDEPPQLFCQTSELWIMILIQLMIENVP